MAPRLSRLASTISRDDIIAVMGARWSSCPESAGGGVALFNFSLIANICQQNPVMPRLTETVDIVIDLKFTLCIPKTTADKADGPEERR
jgi:hypothetical protein